MTKVMFHKYLERTPTKECLLRDVQDGSSVTPSVVSPKMVLVFLFFKGVKIILSCLSWIVGLFTPAHRFAIPSVKNDLLLLPVSVLASKIKNAQLKSTDLILAVRKRMEEINPIINALVDERFEAALKEAAEVDQLIQDALAGSSSAKEVIANKPLLGIPFTVKDSIAVEGLVQSAGSLSRKGHKAQFDAPAVKKLKESGAISIAMSNVPEMLLWWDANNLLYGRTSNPHDLSRIAGGSSGGEAALLATASSIFGLGSDMGGSIRIPGAYCGVFGHKPSPGIVSFQGMWPEAPQKLDPYVAFGPLTRYASDLKLCLTAMAKSQEEIDKLQLDEPVHLKDVKLFWMENEGGNPLFSAVQPEILSRLREVVDFLRQGFDMPAEQVSFGKMLYAMEMWNACLSNEDPRTAEDLMKISSGRESVSLTQELFKTALGQSQFSFNLLFLALIQKAIGVEKDSKGFHRLLLMAKELKEEVCSTLGKNGILLCPTMPEVAPKHNTTALKGVDVSFCGVFNVLGLPSTQVPVGFNSEGLPIGIQVISVPFNDRLCLETAAQLEKAFGGWCHPM